MKILQVCHSFSPCFEAGGVVRVVYELSKKLAQNGYEIVVYTTDGCVKRLNVRTNYPVNQDGIQIYYFKNLSNLLRVKLKIATPYYIFNTAREIKNFDIIHIHEHRTILAVIIHHYAKKYNIPYVLEPQGSILRLNGKEKFKKMFDVLIGNKIISDAYKVIAGTEMELEELQIMGVPNNKKALILPGYNVNSFSVLPKRGQLREKYQIKERNIILFLGRIDEIKGVDFLIRSFAELVHSRSDVFLVIAGPDSSYKSVMENLVAELNLSSKVLFTGYLDGEEKLSAYVDADIFAQLSRYERFCGSPFEATMCNIPVITTKDTGCGEFIKKMDFGYTVIYGDLIGLNNTIKKILNDPHESKLKTERCKNFIQQNLDMEKKWEEYIKLYQDAIKGV